ncbi:SDR family oxidoreductase [Methylobacterium aquaticum]|uniref:SDR family oxidoreductase n=1 Tax=Methylobacterium aquaticum TaxID=270351 RepID=UPI003D170BA1
MRKLASLFDLNGKVAVVTGGSRGLGLQIARALGEYGASLVLVARKADELRETCAALADEGIKARPCVADLSRPEVAALLVDEVMTNLGRIDILVNNAGATWGAPAEDYPLDGWDKVMGLNVSSVFHLTRETAKRAFLPQGGGVVLNLASIEGLVAHHPGRTGTVAYNTSKGAVISMTRALAAEWGPRNIRVNAVAPGYFPSRMTAGTLDAHGADLVAQTPRGVLGGDCDLMGPSLLLVSDAGAHITGQTIVVDGGMTII